MIVNDDPTAEWLSQLDLDGIQALPATSKRSGESNHPNLHVDVRLLKLHHVWEPVAGADPEFEPCWGTQLRFDHAHFASPGAPAEVQPD